MILALAKATALILALGLLHGFNLQLLGGHPRMVRWVAGLLFGGMCVFAMHMPIVVTDGVIFDSRSAVLGIAALYGGPLVGAIAGAIAAFWRLYLGGAGTGVGITVIVAAVCVGLIYRLGVQRLGWSKQALPLLGFGVVLHVIALLLFLRLPEYYHQAVFTKVALPFLAIMAPATALLGLILNAIEDRAQTARALAASQEQLQAIAAASPDIQMVLDDEGRILEVHSGDREVLRTPADEIVGKTLYEVLPTADATEFHQFVRNTLQLEEPQRIDYTLETSVGLRSFEARSRALGVPVQGRPAVVVVARDITDRLAHEAELRIAAQAFEAQQGLVISDANTRILRVNRTFCRITGYQPHEVIGRNAQGLVSGTHDDALQESIWQALREHDGWQGEVWNRRKNGALFPARLTISVVRSKAGDITHYVESLEDLTQSKQAEREIHSLAFYDHLTALPNRRLLTERLETTMNALARTQEHGALLFIDLDDFKKINDLHNHHNGDLILQQVAQRLRSLAEPDHTAARFGADEFVILMAHLGSDPDEATHSVERVADSILERLQVPFTLENRQYRTITASIGIVLFRAHQPPAKDVILQADLAMNEAKQRGKNRWHFFDPAVQKRVTQRLQLEEALKRGIDQQQFMLHYQPQVNAKHEVIGVEALARWPQAPEGAASPGIFISVAERAGLMPALGKVLLEQVCVQLAAWQHVPTMRHLRIAINLSVSQLFQPSFVSDLLETLQRTGAPSNRLVLEITESILLNDLDEAHHTLSTLGAHGIRFSVDDFGTGYSSLAYLQRLPLSELKIDRSFITDLQHAPNNQAIVETIVALASALRLEVVAEGVESVDQVQLLQARGCMLFQGYLFAKAMPPKQLETWVEHRQLQPVHAKPA